MTVREAMGQINETAVSRYLGSLDMSYNQTPNLTYSATVGYDYTAAATSGSRASATTWTCSRRRRDGRPQRVQRQHARRHARHQDRVQPQPRLQLEHGHGGRPAGLQQEPEDTGANSQAFPGPGIEVVGAGGTAITNSETLLTTINGGYFGQTQIGWHDWVFTTVGGRYDFSSAFGENAPGVFYPKASLSIVPSDRKSWSSTRLSTLRFRAPSASRVVSRARSTSSPRSSR